MASFHGVGTVISGERYVELHPKIPTGKAGIIYCHSSNGSPTETLDFSGVNRVIALLVGMGHPVIASDFKGTPGGLTAWGNPSSLAGVSAAHEHLINSMGARDDKVGMVGLSMGGITSLAWTGQNPDLVAAVLGFIPCVDLTDVHTNDRISARSLIDTAYGGYSEATYGAQHNPMTLAKAGAYATIPIRTYYASTDNVTPPSIEEEFATHSGAVATQLIGDHTHTTVAQVDADEAANFIHSAIE